MRDVKQSQIESEGPVAFMHLLVSVRNAEEAKSAIAGGCEILDIKEPHRGSLGMADLDSIADVVGRYSPLVPVSVALGELRDWRNADQLPSLPLGIAYCKLGLAGCGSIPNWKNQWSEWRTHIDAASRGKLHWVAVAYADWQRADAPAPEAVIQAAGDANCAGVLFDTFVKDDLGLLQWFSTDQLSRLVDLIHHKSLFAAIAGGLRMGDLPQLAGVDVDIVAVRGVACRGNDRRATVCSDAVREFRQAMVLSTGEEMSPEVIRPTSG